VIPELGFPFVLRGKVAVSTSRLDADTLRHEIEDALEAEGARELEERGGRLYFLGETSARPWASVFMLTVDGGVFWVEANEERLSVHFALKLYQTCIFLSFAALGALVLFAGQGIGAIAGIALAWLVLAGGNFLWAASWNRLFLRRALRVARRA
jgi:hypothetical protein